MLPVIAIGGIDGAGKSRLALHLAKALNLLPRKQSVGARFSRVLQRVGNGIDLDAGRQLAEAYRLDFIGYAKRQSFVDRRSHNGVVFDRWKNCVRAFACRWGQSVDGEALDAIRDADVDILLDVPVDVALVRIRMRGAPDADETEDELVQMRAAYQKLAIARPEIVVVDANRAFESVLREVVALVSPAVFDRQ